MPHAAGVLTLMVMLCLPAAAGTGYSPDGAEEISLRYTLDPIGPPIRTLGQRMPVSEIAPAGIKLPRFISPKPLFLTARLGEGAESTYHFALDETVRGGGYDRLYADSRHTGDLTGGAPVRLTRWRDQTGFKTLRLLIQAGGQPVLYHAAITLDDRGSPPGYRLHPWGYYEGVGRLGEKSYPVALIDYNGNGRYNDWFRGDDEETAGDVLLVDLNGDGRYDEWEFASPEFRPCARWLFIDDRCYELRVRADGAGFALAPPSLPLATLRSGYPEFRLLLASENGRLTVPGRNGQAQVPVGDYRLYGWQIEQQDGDGSRWVVQGNYGRSGDEMPVLSVKADRPLPHLGSPLVASLEVIPLSEREFQYLLRFTAASGERINEVSRNRQRMPEPRLRITDAHGRELANLPFHYG